MRVVVRRSVAAKRRAGAGKNRMARLGESWCRLMHSEITWPVNGYYSCRKCRRRFPVPWEAETVRVVATTNTVPQLIRQPLPPPAEAAA